MSENTQDSAWPPCETTLFSGSVVRNSLSSLMYDTNSNLLGKQTVQDHWDHQNCPSYSQVVASEKNKRKRIQVIKMLRLWWELKRNIGWGKFSWYTNKFSQIRLKKIRKLGRRINILTKDWNSYVASKQLTCFSSHLFVLCLTCSGDGRYFSKALMALSVKITWSHFKINFLTSVCGNLSEPRKIAVWK